MKPKRIIIIRHGESEGNKDKTIYNHTPDYKVNLTEKGREQARKAGLEIKDLIKNESIGIYCSPYHRARQTREELIKSFDKQVMFCKEYPELIEHEWSTHLRTDDKKDEEKARDTTGKFYYRFKNGESSLDVHVRVGLFFGVLHRDFKKVSFPKNCLLVTHGMTARNIVTRWFHWSVEIFETLRNPRNCEFYIMNLNTYNKYDLIKGPEVKKS